MAYALCSTNSIFRASSHPIVSKNKAIRRHQLQGTAKATDLKKIEACSPQKQPSNRTGVLLWTATALGLGYGLFAHTSAAEAMNLLNRDSQIVVGRNLGDLGMGPEGPLLEEFWDNMRRYGIYFITVASGGLYTIVKPIFDLLTNPATAVLALVIIIGGLYLIYLTLSAMLGLTPTDYPY